jgi:hypothetical protein
MWISIHKGAGLYQKSRLRQSRAAGQE